MKELNLEIAGEFLVMASTLLQIKSQLLLPSPALDDPSVEDEDPRAELIRRLLEYQKYKEAADLLDTMDQSGRDLFVCRLEEPEQEQTGTKEEILEVELFELIEAFRNVLSRMPVEKYHEVSAEPISISDRINELLSVLQEKECIKFSEFFSEKGTREDVIATFLAILELCKRKMVKTIQAGLFGEILITPAVLEEDADDLQGAGVTYA
jgi:segregation and condensation protein A